MPQLGTIQKITDLRKIWPHEANDFTKWLSEEQNLALLSDAVGIDIAFEERESSVGSFSLDIYAYEEGSNRKIIIENQLEDTDHDHLGKIITYAFGKSAEVIIWIVKRARDEHRQAIEWLNQHTDENIGFFLLEIELWQINDSLPAPKFNIVEKPNDWAKSMKASEGLTETQRVQLQFWQEFNNYAPNHPGFSSIFRTVKAQPHHWYDLSAGSSAYHISLTANTRNKRMGAEIYISENKDLFLHFQSKRQEIEEFMGSVLDWREAKKACRILILQPGDIKGNPSDWNAYFSWLCDMAIKFRKVTQKYGTM